MDNRGVHHTDHVEGSPGATARLEEDMDHLQAMAGMVIAVHQWVTSMPPQPDTMTVIEEIDHVLVIVITIHRGHKVVVEEVEITAAHRGGSAIGIQVPLTMAVVTIVSMEAVVMEEEGMIEDITVVGIRW